MLRLTECFLAQAVKVEVQAEVKLEGVASWGAKQRRTVASAKPRDIAVSSAAVPLHDAHSTTSGQARSSAAHKPGQAAGPSRLKAHARLAAVKKEDQTLTALLTARSAVCIPKCLYECFLNHYLLVLAFYYSIS